MMPHECKPQESGVQDTEHKTQHKFTEQEPKERLKSQDRFIFIINTGQGNISMSEKGFHKSMPGLDLIVTDLTVRAKGGMGGKGGEGKGPTLDIAPDLVGGAGGRGGAGNGPAIIIGGQMLRDNSFGTSGDDDEGDDAEAGRDVFRDVSNNSASNSVSSPPKPALKNVAGVSSNRSRTRSASILAGLATSVETLAASSREESQFESTSASPARREKAWNAMIAEEGAELSDSEFAAAVEVFGETRYADQYLRFPADRKSARRVWLNTAIGRISHHEKMKNVACHCNHQKCAAMQAIPALRPFFARLCKVLGIAQRPAYGVTCQCSGPWRGVVVVVVVVVFIFYAVTGQEWLSSSTV
ncbi:hypothetical protein B0H11DRAFT_1905944 [Mycena galericulata]|nr:hypothetical protein B0H11DRAFT_1905944 [Mycena galericulata]